MPKRGRIFRVVDYRRAQRFSAAGQLDGEVIPGFGGPVELRISVMRIAQRDLPRRGGIIRVAIFAALHVETAKRVLIEPVFHGGSDGVFEIQHKDPVALGYGDSVVLLTHLPVLNHQIVVNGQAGVPGVGVHQFNVAILHHAAFARSVHPPAPEVRPAHGSRADGSCWGWIGPVGRFIKSAVVPAEEDAPMMRMVVGRNAGDGFPGFPETAPA